MTFDSLISKFKFFRFADMLTKSRCAHYDDNLQTDWNKEHCQTRHNFVGEIRIFSAKICINPYPSFMHIAMQFIKKSRHCEIQNRQPAAKNQNQSFTDRPTSRGATVGSGLRL